MKTKTLSTNKRMRDAVVWNPSPAMLEENRVLHRTSAEHASRARGMERMLDRKRLGLPV